MKWPPNKAWTSSSPKKGFCHFVAINYGGKGFDRWVNLVSVLDGNVRVRVLWEEMQDTSKWLIGWRQQIREDHHSLEPESNNPLSNQEINDSCCLHPSIDSGLALPIKVSKIRPWFKEDEN